MKIQEITNSYKNKLDYLDIEILIADSLGKTREFVLMYPSHELSKSQILNLKSKLNRRMKSEPIAQIIGHKEFFGLDFIVNKHTLVPRPETEMMVEATIKEISNLKFEISNKLSVIDIGTGSGCIITSITHSIKHGANTKFFATDISSEALKIAKKNAKRNELEKKIRFLQGSLLEPIIKSSIIGNQSSLIITANLPYLSKEIYQSAPIDVKKYEPKSALYSAQAGLQHYRKLLEQIKDLLHSCSTLHVSCFMEISPEQKMPITKLIKSILPKAKIEITKDLAGKWRLCRINI
jgi:release factor glutamine methyltransferase